MALLASILLTGSCALLPYQKADHGITKVAVSRAQADAIYAHYKAVRKNALHLLDAQPLTATETGPVLAIDAGALQVARRLLLTHEPDDSQALRIERVLVPRLSRYPLWFVVVVDDGVRKLTKVQIFERRTSVSTWQMVASPEVLDTTALPAFKVDDTSALTPIGAGSSEGLDLSPTDAVRSYTAALADPSVPAASAVVADSFISQMRAIAREQRRIKGVHFSESWSAQPVQYALRTDDGGALVFATLVRVDRYRIKPGTYVNWPEGSEQKAFLSGRLYTNGLLRYYHQLLMYIPPAGSGKPRVLGQYGGVVSGSGS